MNMRVCLGVRWPLYDNASSTFMHSYSVMSLCGPACVRMHLWMHTGACIILTQLGSTSPCQCVWVYMCVSVCVRACVCTATSCVHCADPQSRYHILLASFHCSHPDSIKLVNTCSYKAVFTHIHAYHCLTQTHLLTWDMIITFHWCFKLF